ncbi:hypothetical protein GPALN_006398 [Globodera pallida]|nr:hypothetical protein GPALN_006398 [Globodera pallida]
MSPVLMGKCAENPRGVWLTQIKKSESLYGRLFCLKCSSFLLLNSSNFAPYDHRPPQCTTASPGVSGTAPPPPPDGVHPLPQRRPVRITPFLYSDALNVAAVRSSADSMRGSAMDWPKSGWDGQKQAMLQITPFFYSSAKRRRIRKSILRLSAG